MGIKIQEESEGSKIVFPKKESDEINRILNEINSLAQMYDSAKFKDRSLMINSLLTAVYKVTNGVMLKDTRDDLYVIDVLSVDSTEDGKIFIAYDFERLKECDDEV